MTAQADARRSEPIATTVGRTFRDQPLIPLLVLLAILRLPCHSQPEG